MLTRLEPVITLTLARIQMYNRKPASSIPVTQAAYLVVRQLIANAATYLPSANHNLLKILRNGIRP
jgi:hypothetical protein